MIIKRTIIPAALLAIAIACFSSSAFASPEQAFQFKAKRIVFLGDSITNAGGYVAWIETQMRLHGIDPLPEIINLGLSSETCTGLSEPDHPFPRPDVHERLDRALTMLKPDVVVACYGMNDGIYYPFSEERFATYQDGVNRLIDKVHASGAKLILLTPPPFDPEPLRGTKKIKPAGEEKYAWFAMYEGYDEVIQRYGRWIMKQGDRVAMVVDVHTPVSEYVAEQRKTNPKFTAAPDGVHMNAAGHRTLGTAIVKAWGIESNPKPDEKLLQLVAQKTKLLHDAWLSKVGHKRPGVKPGLPIDEAQAKARELEKQIEQLVQQSTIVE